MILWGGVRRLAFRLAPLSAALLLGGCDWAVLDPKGPIADANRQILIDSLAIMLAIVVPTIVAISRSPGGSGRPTRARAICLTGNIRARSS